MAKMIVNGASLTYQLFGRGPAMVFTPGGWSGIQPSVSSFLGSMSARCQVLAYDRRNCGDSDSLIEDAPSEFDLWADDLHDLLTSLGMVPAYVAGESLWQALSLLFAHLHPQDVRGLILFAQPDDNRERRSRVASARYSQLADVAEHSGMQGVVDRCEDPSMTGSPMRSVCNSINHATSQENLLRMDPAEFAAIIRKWAAWFTTDRIFVCNLPDHQVREITIPSPIVPGLDEIHPHYMTDRLHELLPNSEVVEYASSLDEEAMEGLRTELTTSGHGREMFRLSAVAPAVEAFIKKVEASQ